MVSTNFLSSRADTAKRHDRYLVYGLIGRRVTFANPSRRARRAVSGVVEDVCRNIFDNEVELVLDGGRVFRFPEPAAIVEERGGVVAFVYGEVGRRELTDAGVFREMRAAAMGENVNDVLRRTQVEETRVARFVPEDAEAATA